MTDQEWLTSEEPDLMLEHLMAKVSRGHLITFVRLCWIRVITYVPPVPHDFTVVDQFVEVANQLSDHDAVVYASEAALKAAGLAPDMRAEQRQQAELLRQIVGRVVGSERDKMT
jgi:hypothetical protein